MSFKRFVAIDGESFTEDDDHRYVLLASSTKDYAYKPEGLSTAECFQFLLKLRRQRKSYIFVAFGLNYDVNMMLRDVGKDKLKQLWKDHEISWHGYKISWIPGKWFDVRRNGTGIRIFDVFGFFQKSFVNSLKAWDIELSADLESMKAQRSIFDSGMAEQMIEYCIGECNKLVELMSALRDALNSVGLQPASWVGAGSIAATLLKREGVRAGHRYDSEWQPDVERAILHAYFGGRVELFQQGRFDHITDYDINSAYPSQALHLPSMIGGLWKRAETYNPHEPYALWLCRWNVDPASIVMPFPYRHKRGIFYPSSGLGWYHAPEVKRAREQFPTIEILDGWIYQPLTDERPFSFIRAQFDYRRELKANKHPGEKVLKLGLNAIYGKLAQGEGFKGRKPTYQSFYWSGRITSGTRARLFDIASYAPEQLVMVATDGIFFRDPAPVFETSKALGGLDVSTFTDMFVAQAGVYQGTIDGETISRSRGFFAREIDWLQLRQGFAEDGPYFTAEYPSRRFVGLGSALIRKDLSLWRTWHESTRKLSMYPNRKFIRSGYDFDGLPVRHFPPTFDGGELSQMYVVKDAQNKWADDVVEFIEGTEQPLRDY